jgi:hypothetical protein
MSKSEIDIEIGIFLKKLIYEAQFIAFQNKLLQNISDSTLKSYAESELNKIRMQIKKGRYKKNDPLSFQNKLIAENERKQRQRKMKKGEEKIKQLQKNSKPVPYRFQNITYKNLAETIETDFEYFRRLMLSKMPGFKAQENDILNDTGWYLIRSFVLKSIREIKEKEKDKYTYGKTRKIHPNFGRLIYTGQTN